MRESGSLGPKYQEPAVNSKVVNVYEKSTREATASIHKAVGLTSTLNVVHHEYSFKCRRKMLCLVTDSMNTSPFCFLFVLAHTNRNMTRD